jgi:antitoxin component YwqK of YwqJK toxin-antitoxin module
MLMARDVSSILYRLALGSSLSLGCLAAVAGEAPRAAREAHINVYESDEGGEATAADTDITPLPEAADESAALDREPQTEIITERYPNRAVRIERHVSQDEDGNYFNHGAWSHWDENGVLKGSGEFRYGRRHGKWVRWFNANEGKIVSSALYKQFQAPFAAEATFEDGKLHGAWTIYDSQGRLASEWQFEQGELHGKSIWYFPSGHKQREADYQNGQIEGQLLEWSFEAEPAAKLKNGRTQPRGELEHKLVAKATYANGRRQAPHIDYYSPGAKKAEGMYLFAKETTKTTYDFWNGEVFTTVIGKEGVNQRHGQWTFWYKDGGKQMEGEFEQDKPVGKHVWWYSNGQKQAEGEFEAGLEVGKWTWWHTNGQKMTEGEFVDGVQVGRWLRWNTMGLVEESRDYDKLHVAEEPRPTRPAPQMQPMTPPSDRATVRQPRPMRVESARRNSPMQSPNQIQRR